MSLLALHAAHAETLSFKFQDSNDTPFAAGDTAGAADFAVTNWNFLQTDWSGSDANDGVFGAIKNASGADTTSLLNITYGVHTDPVHYDAANTWRSGIGNATPNDTLMNGYLDDGLDNQPYVNFSLSDDALPRYSVVVYIHGDAANGPVGRYWIEEWTDPLQEGTVITDQVGISSNDYTGTFMQAGSGFRQTLTPANVDVASGNYLVFENLTARNFRVRGAGNGDPEDFGRGPINAIQILDFADNPEGDNDNDGLTNGWELGFDLDPESALGENGADGNPDGDGLSNLEEQALGTNPRLADTDGDGLDDDVESNSGVFIDASDTGTDPLDRDTDDDGLLDGVETNDGNFVDENMTGSNPFEPDSDSDGLPDNWEVTNQLDPNDDGTTEEDNGPAGDPDMDFSNNAQEFALGTNPRVNDTDEDGLLDGYETNTGAYLGETDTGTDPLNSDTDGDSLSDGVETNDQNFQSAEATGTSPLVRDSDGDGYFDNQEVDAGTDPTDAASRPPFPAPLAFWTFDDQGADVTADAAGGNDASVVGQATYVAGHSGRPNDFAMSFDGLDDAATTSLSLNGFTQYTVSGWVNPAAIQNANAGIFGQNDVLESGFQVDSILHVWSNPGGPTNSTLVPNNEWFHLAYVGDVTGRTTYINGEAVAVIPGAVPLGESTFFFNMGGGGIFGPTENFYQGEINDVAIWPISLAPGLISSLADGSITPLPFSGGELTIVSFARTEGNAVSFTVGGTLPGVEYLIEQSLTLQEGDWTEATDFTGAADANTTVVNVPQVGAPEAKLFYRARVLEVGE